MDSRIVSHVFGPTLSEPLHKPANQNNVRFAVKIANKRTYSSAARSAKCTPLQISKVSLLQKRGAPCCWEPAEHEGGCIEVHTLPWHVNEDFQVASTSTISNEIYLVTMKSHCCWQAQKFLKLNCHFSSDMLCVSLRHAHGGKLK